MDVAHQANADQIAYWNGPNGQRWTDRQASQDVLLAPVSQLLIDRIGSESGRSHRRYRLRLRRHLDRAGRARRA